MIRYLFMLLETNISKKLIVILSINIRDTFSFLGKVVQHLFGKCSEALYCGQAPSAKCIWRPGALPVDANLNYGFSRFAIELNEILPKERGKLPHTDTRFRPDQRCLEVTLFLPKYWYTLLFSHI